MSRVFWVKVDDANIPLKFDYDTDELAKGYPSYEAYFQSFCGDEWEDGKGNPVRTKYVIQDVDPDENTMWLDGPEPKQPSLKQEAGLSP